MRQPLAGIRVLELGMFHAGPGGSAILGDLGAEVIKIEQPDGGDPVRNLKQVSHVMLEIPGGGSIWYEAANRSKKSVTIDLRQAKGREALYRLVEKSDVFITSLRGPAIERMNLSYPVLAKINPKLIYAHISSFGKKGPDRNLGGFDYQGQGRSGLMYSVGEPEMTPLVSQFGIVDQSTSIMLSHAILTALFERERSGIGQEVHVSILGTALFMHYINALIALIGNFDVPRHNRATEDPLRNYYKCADEKWLIMTMPPLEKYWPMLCRAIEHAELENDAKFDTFEKRLANSVELVALLDRIFATRPREEWCQILAQHDLPYAPVHRPTELKDDPQILENDYILDFNHPRLGKIKIPGYPVQFSESWAGTTACAPLLGEHTESVLADIGGYSHQEVAELRAEGVI